MEVRFTESAVIASSHLESARIQERNQRIVSQQTRTDQTSTDNDTRPWLKHVRMLRKKRILPPSLLQYLNKGEKNQAAQNGNKVPYRKPVKRLEDETAGTTGYKVPYRKPVRKQEDGSIDATGKSSNTVSSNTSGANSSAIVNPSTSLSFTTRSQPKSSSKPDNLNGTTSQKTRTSNEKDSSVDKGDGGAGYSTNLNNTQAYKEFNLVKYASSEISSSADMFTSSSDSSQFTQKSSILASPSQQICKVPSKPEIQIKKLATNQVNTEPRQITAQSKQIKNGAEDHANISRSTRSLRERPRNKEIPIQIQSMQQNSSSSISGNSMKASKTAMEMHQIPQENIMNETICGKNKQVKVSCIFGQDQDNVIEDTIKEIANECLDSSSDTLKKSAAILNYAKQCQTNSSKPREQVGLATRCIRNITKNHQNNSSLSEKSTSAVSVTTLQTNSDTKQLSNNPSITKDNIVPLKRTRSGQAKTQADTKCNSSESDSVKNTSESSTENTKGKDAKPEIKNDPADTTSTKPIQKVYQEDSNSEQAKQLKQLFSKDTIQLSHGVPGTKALKIEFTPKTASQIKDCKVVLKNLNKSQSSQNSEITDYFQAKKRRLNPQDDESNKMLRPRAVKETTVSKPSTHDQTESTVIQSPKKSGVLDLSERNLKPSAFSPVKSPRKQEMKDGASNDKDALAKRARKSLIFDDGEKPGNDEDSSEKSGPEKMEKSNPPDISVENAEKATQNNNDSIQQDGPEETEEANSPARTSGKTTPYSPDARKESSTLFSPTMSVDFDVDESAELNDETNSDIQNLINKLSSDADDSATLESPTPTKMSNPFPSALDIKVSSIAIQSKTKPMPETPQKSGKSKIKASMIAEDPYDHVDYRKNGSTNFQNLMKSASVKVAKNLTSPLPWSNLRSKTPTPAPKKIFKAKSEEELKKALNIPSNCKIVVVQSQLDAIAKLVQQQVTHAQSVQPTNDVIVTQNLFKDQSDASNCNIENKAQSCDVTAKKQDEGMKFGIGTPQISDKAENTNFTKKSDCARTEFNDNKQKNNEIMSQCADVLKDDKSNNIQEKEAQKTEIANDETQSIDFGDSDMTEDDDYETLSMTADYEENNQNETEKMTQSQKQTTTVLNNNSEKENSKSVTSTSECLTMFEEIKEDLAELAKSVTENGNKNQSEIDSVDAKSDVSEKLLDQESQLDRDLLDLYMSMSESEQSPVKASRAKTRESEEIVLKMSLSEKQTTQTKSVEEIALKMSTSETKSSQSHTKSKRNFVNEIESETQNSERLLSSGNTDQADVLDLSQGSPFENGQRISLTPVTDIECSSVQNTENSQPSNSPTEKIEDQNENQAQNLTLAMAWGDTMNSDEGNLHATKQQTNDFLESQDSQTSFMFSLGSSILDKNVIGTLKSGMRIGEEPASKENEEVFNVQWGNTVESNETSQDGYKDKRVNHLQSNEIEMNEHDTSGELVIDLGNQDTASQIVSITPLDLSSTRKILSQDKSMQNHHAGTLTGQSTYSTADNFSAELEKAYMNMHSESASMQKSAESDDDIVLDLSRSNSATNGLGSEDLDFHVPEQSNNAADINGFDLSLRSENEATLERNEDSLAKTPQTSTPCKRNQNKQITDSQNSNPFNLSSLSKSSSLADEHKGNVEEDLACVMELEEEEEVNLLSESTLVSKSVAHIDDANDEETAPSTLQSVIRSGYQTHSLNSLNVIKTADNQQLSATNEISTTEPLTYNNNIALKYYLTTDQATSAAKSTTLVPAAAVEHTYIDSDHMNPATESTALDPAAGVESPAADVDQAAEPAATGPVTAAKQVAAADLDPLQLVDQIRDELLELLEEESAAKKAELQGLDDEIQQRRLVLDTIQQNLTDQSLKMDRLIAHKEKCLFQMEGSVREAKINLEKYPFQVMIDKAKESEKALEKSERALKTLENKITNAKSQLKHWLSDDNRKHLEKQNATLEQEVKANRAKLQALKYCVDEMQNRKTSQLTNRTGFANCASISEMLEKCYLPQSIAKRANNPTDRSMVNDPAHNNEMKIRYLETKKVMEYIHGGQQGALYGAVNYLVTQGSVQVMRDLAILYKKAKENAQTIEQTESDNTTLDTYVQDRKRKYGQYLQKRKFKFLCKIQTAVIEGREERAFKRITKLANMTLRDGAAFHADNLSRAVDHITKFMGPVFQIPRVMGVSRTVTGTALMIMHHLLSVDNLAQSLVWLDNLPNHFVFQFMDDAGPEDVQLQLAMSMGVLTCWNLGERRAHPDHQYMLHGFTVSERMRSQLMAQVWQQHTDEMAVMEASVFMLCGRRCTVSFEPSADMAWHNWAANDTTQIAHLPSVYGDVKSDNLATLNGVFSDEHGSTWRPFTYKTRKENAARLNGFLQTLDKNLAMPERLLRRREFMTSAHVRQLGLPRIGVFVERLRPEPLQLELRVWRHLLLKLCEEALSAKMFNNLISVLSAEENNAPPQPEESSDDAAPSTSTQRYGFTYGSNKCAPVKVATRGCGLPHHFSASNTLQEGKLAYPDLPMTSDDVMLLSRNWALLVDALRPNRETNQQKILRFAYSKVGEHLNEAMSLVYAKTTNHACVERCAHLFKTLYNIIILFLDQSVLTLNWWALCHALPHHMRALYEQYRVGYGMAFTAPPSSDSAAPLNNIRQDLQWVKSLDSLKLGKGRWWQLTRVNWARTFYINEHEYQPHTAPYHPTRTSLGEIKGLCTCGRWRQCDVKSHSAVCQVCDDVMMTSVVESGTLGKYVGAVKEFVDESRINGLMTNVLAENL